MPIHLLFDAYGPIKAFIFSTHIHIGIQERAQGKLDNDQND